MIFQLTGSRPGASASGELSRGLPESRGVNRPVRAFLLLLILCSCRGPAGAGSDSQGPDLRGDLTLDTAAHGDIIPAPGPSLDLLFSEQKQVLSRRGASTYLWLPRPDQVPESEGVLSGPQLGRQQFSDVLSHLGLYQPIMDPLAELVVPGACGTGGFQWLGTHARRSSTCGDLEVEETLLYSSPDTVAVRYRISNSGGETEVRVQGALGQVGLSWTIDQVEKAGFTLGLQAQFLNLWSPTETRDWSFSLALTPEPDSLTPPEEGSSWSATYPLPADSETTLVLTWTLAGTEGRSGLDPEGFDQALTDLKQELTTWMSQAPPGAELDHFIAALSWMLLWENTISPQGNWTREAIVPSKRHYGRGVWLWDAAFIAVTLSSGGPDAVSLARKQVDLFIDNVLQDGHLPREIWTGDLSVGTQPPGLMTWAALKVNERLAARDAEAAQEYLTKDYQVFAGNHRWFLKTRDSDGDGLCEWEGLDSGWDTSPRWDDGPVEALDLACWLVLDSAMLAEMAKRLGKEEEAREWAAEAALLSSRIREEFWDPEAKAFYDLEIGDNSLRRTVTPATFLPLLVHAATEEQAAAVTGLLKDPTLLGTPWPLPTTAASSPVFDPADYWRGPVWIVLNTFAIWGLQGYGLDEEADRLRDATFSLMGDKPTTYEYYNPLTGEGLGAPDFMWSGAFYNMLWWGEIFPEVLPR